MKTPKKITWIVVCDGKKALYLENTGHGPLKLEMRHVEEHPDPRSGEINSDAPGRTMNASGSRRSSMDDGDAHDLTERQFLKGIAEKLEEIEFDEFILVAPPRALGVLRQKISPQIKKKLRAEIENDLVNLSIEEIERHLNRDLKPTLV